MSPDQQKSLDAELGLDEGTLLYAYDDATGKRIIPGYTVKGNVTVGTGTNIQFLFPEENEFLLRNREQKALTTLSSHLPWFSAANPVRQNALIDLYYNVPSFLGWPKFIYFCGLSMWNDAANELLNTHPWIDQVKERGQRIADKLRNGV